MSASPIAAVERLRPQEIDARLAEASIAYLPFGSLEFHGPHLPIGLDALTAHGICIAAAQRKGGIVLPPFFQAVGGEHVLYPWTIMSDAPDAIEALVLESLQRLSDLGVRRALLFSGHFADEQRDLLSGIAERWNSGTPPMRAIARTLGHAPEPPVAPDHAGRFESLILHSVAPELVHIDALPDPVTHPAPVGEDPYGQTRHQPDHPLHGIFGADPRELDFASAGPLFDYLADWVADVAAER